MTDTKCKRDGCEETPMPYPGYGWLCPSHYRDVHEGDQDIEKLRAENERLWELLKNMSRYTKHTIGCARAEGYKRMDRNLPDCDCGLAELSKAALEQPDTGGDE